MCGSGVRIYTQEITVVVQLTVTCAAIKIRTESFVGAAGQTQAAAADQQSALMPAQVTAMHLSDFASPDQTNSVFLIEGNYANG